MYRIYLIDNNNEVYETDNGRKMKSLYDELTAGKKELEITAVKLVHSVDKKVKETEKKKDGD